MPYELVSRSLAIVSCLSTLSLAMTSVAFAAVNIGKLNPTPACGSLHCSAHYARPSPPGSNLDREITMRVWFATAPAKV